MFVCRVCNLDPLVLSFTLFPSINTEGRSAFARWRVAGASSPMCWLQGPAHIHMFPVCLAQQDTGWLHALLISPTAPALQGHEPNSILQHTLVNIMVSTALEIWYYGRGQTAQSAARDRLLLLRRRREVKSVSRGNWLIVLSLLETTNW